MKDALKSMNKKYLIVIASIFAILFLIILVVAVTRACSKPGSNYERVEKKLVDGAKKYFKDNPDAKPTEGNSVTVSATTLSEGKYMKALSAYLKDTSCVADVKVYNNGGQYLVVPNLECAEYKTTHLADKIKNDNLISTSQNSYEENEQNDPNANSLNNNQVSNQQINEDNNSNDYISGLDDVNGVYIFKGKKPNNYLTFGGIKWRIIDIDENNIIRALKIDSEKRSQRWDTKYNVDVKDSKGINDYKNSTILETLNTEYGKFKDENKQHLAPMSVCIGKRNDKLLGTSRDIDCSSRLDNQYISLINSGDYARASLDEHCTSITSGSCVNYNYLSSILIQSWTTNTHLDNSYQAIAINSGLAHAFDAKEALKYNWVIAINGDEKFTKGDGTESNPYVVGTSKKK